MLSLATSLAGDDNLRLKDQNLLLRTAKERIAQLFRKIDTITFVYKIEQSLDDGKTWEMGGLYSIVLDNRIGLFFSEELIPDGTGKHVFYLSRLTAGGKTITFTDTLDSDGKLSLEIKKKMKRPNVSIKRFKQKQRPTIPWLTDHVFNVDVNDIFSSKNFIKSSINEKGDLVLIIKGSVGVVDEYLTFDAKTGNLLRYHREFLSDGEMKKGVVIDYESPKNVNGWNIPLVKTRKTPKLELDGKTFPARMLRYSIEPDSISINTLPEKPIKAYFEIPVGAYVRDTIKGISYKQPGINGDLTQESISKELDKMIEEGKKLKKAAQKAKITEKK